MIKSFKNKCAEDIFDGKQTKHARILPKKLHQNAQEKLDMLNAAYEIRDLKIPPGNRLEKLKGSRKHQYSIRINDQWRLCFTWNGGHAEEVEIVDYHK